MADTLFMRLIPDGTASWAVFDQFGRLAGSVSQGPLALARDDADGRKLTVLVPAVDIMHMQATLPAASAARLRQIVPFSLEDALAADVETLFFAVGSRATSGNTPVSIVARERLERWLAELSAAGLSAQTMCSEAEGVPNVPSTLVLIVEGERIYGRRPDQPPFVLDGISVDQAIGMVRAEVGENPDFDRVLVYASANDQVSIQTDISRLDEHAEDVDVRIAAQGVFAQMAATLAQRPGISFLQGPYAPKSNWVALARPWRFAASLLVATACLALVLQGARFWQLLRSDQSLSDLVTVGCQRVVGDPRLSNCQRGIQARLTQSSAGPAAQEFLTTLAGVATARKENMRIDALSYRNGTMDLQLMVDSVPALDEFARTLEQANGFAVEIEAANQTDDGTQGRVRISGATR